MLRTAAFMGLVAFGVLSAVGPSSGGPASNLAVRPDTSAEPMILAQAQTTIRRRPRIRINPRYPYRNFTAVYPLPYDYEYPGPRGVRHCVDNYVTELRPSGAVIVPRMRCWWVVRR